MFIIFKVVVVEINLNSRFKYTLDCAFIVRIVETMFKVYKLATWIILMSNVDAPP